jgi:hypothetical protein
MATNIAGMNQTQNNAFANIAGNQGIWQPNVAAGGQAIANAGQGIGAADIANFYNPYQQDVTNATLNQIGQADALQNRAYTANEASQGGLGGNGYFVGRSQLQGQQGQNRNNTLANLNSQGFAQALAAAQADKTRGLQAGQAQAGIGQIMSQLAGSDASQLLASGNQQQQQQQNVNNAASQNAKDQQLYPMQNQQWLAGIAGALGPLMGGTTATQGTATQSQGKGAGSVLGPAMSMAAMASDERVKENIEEVGTTHDGQPIYSFRYKGDPRTQMGLMAQDVERGDHPEAVSQGLGGMKMVNYDQALVNAKPMADGGRMGFDDGVMGWAPLNPASLKIPDAPNISAPQQQKEEFDPQAAWDMGKKAGAGLQSLFGGSTGPAASSPAGGAMAASGLQGLGGSGGLASLFGFADGGGVSGDDFLMGGDEYDDLARAMRPDVIRAESGGDPSVVSPKGARGLMQIMPETAREPGYGVRPLQDNSDAENVRFGTDYLAAMLRKYKGDKQAAAVAYNGGPARGDNWLKSGRNDAAIPRESADYYKKVLGDEMAPLMAKATLPTTRSTEPVGEPYQNKADKKTGGLLGRMFGVEFNPFNLTEPERRAMLVAGLSMWSSGDIGRGGLAGMQYLAGAEAGERDSRTAAQKLAYDMSKDEKDLALRTRAEDRQGAKDKADQSWREGEVGRKNSELTTDQKEFDAAVKAGYDKDFVTFQLDQKRAGAAKGEGASLPAEVAARIELGRVFTRMVPDIEKRIGDLGVKGRASLAAGTGKGAELWRDIEAGREALIRSLTGAGMSAGEATNAAARYQIGATDTDKTMLSKVRQLKKHLEATEKGAIEGKSGAMSRDYNAPTPVKTEKIRMKWNPETGGLDAVN